MFPQHPDDEESPFRATEAQNCIAEAQMVCSQRDADCSETIQEAADAGKFMIIGATPHYCRATDAIVGQVRFLHAAFDTEEAMEAALQEIYARETPDDTSYEKAYPTGYVRKQEPDSTLPSKEPEEEFTLF
jgi:hypothetical protein